MVEPLMVGHWQFIVSKAINMCSLNLTSSIGDFSQASLPELPQRFVIPSVTSYRRWRYFCVGFLLSPFCHLLLRLQVVGRTHQARGFLNGKTTTATKPRSLVFSSGWGRSCPSELGRMGSHWVAWGGVRWSRWARCDYPGLRYVPFCITVPVDGEPAQSPSCQSISSYSHSH